MVQSGEDCTVIASVGEDKVVNDKSEKGFVNL